MTWHLTQRQDFERVLQSRPVMKTAHFSLHHMVRPASATAPNAVEPCGQSELSTGLGTSVEATVDDCCAATKCHGVGVVVPRRLARRAVTRSLVKRQAYRALERIASGMACAADTRTHLWVLRLRAGYDRARYPSAASDALRLAVREELEKLVAAMRPGAA